MLLAAQAVAIFALHNRGEDESCGGPFELHLHSPYVSRAGAGRLRRHTAAAAVLTCHLKSTGAAVKLEAAVLELYHVGEDGASMNDSWTGSRGGLAAAVDS